MRVWVDPSALRSEGLGMRLLEIGVLAIAGLGAVMILAALNVRGVRKSQTES